MFQHGVSILFKEEYVSKVCTYSYLNENIFKTVYTYIYYYIKKNIFKTVYILLFRSIYFNFVNIFLLKKNMFKLV